MDVIRQIACLVFSLNMAADKYVHFQLQDGGTCRRIHDGADITFY